MVNMSVLQPVLNVINFLCSVCYYILAVSYHIGRGIFYGLCVVCNFAGDVFSALAIIVEEFYRFLCELDGNVSATLRYVRSTTNHGIGGVIEGVGFFLKEISHFFFNTKVHSKLLATACGQFVADFVDLVRRSLLLIADAAWWTLTIIPRTVINIFIGLGDWIVFSISSIGNLLVHIVRTIIDDIFRYTTAVVIIFVCLKNRRRLLHGLRLAGNKLQMFFRSLRLRRLRTQSSIRASRSPTSRRLPRNPLPPEASDKLLESQRCVVCRDQPKCVLLLPCKHLCLCEDCADYILLVTRTHSCPLCRQGIDRSMSVYI